MKKYVLEVDWQVHAKDMNLSLSDVLRYAQLPPDLLSRSPLFVTADEFFRLWKGIEYAFRDDPAFPLHLARAITPETFSPPLFAALCSRNLYSALSRMAKYKPIVGPLRLQMTQDDDQTKVELFGIPRYEQLPASLVAAEFVLSVQIARIATREGIVPQAVHIVSPLPAKAQYEEYFGTRVIQGEFNGISFSALDMRKPFLTANTPMLSIFEPVLDRRLQNLTQESSFRDRVRACLVEILASGDSSMSDVASRLSMSTRTLQRRLNQENTNFQKELDKLREELARHYLSNSDYTSNQIAFLLGYEESTSFFRAFRIWTGQTPEDVRSNMN
jgi:AraC-like DNA-binding protein